MCLIAVTELATLTPQFQAVSVLISMVDFSRGVGAYKQLLLPNVQGWTKDYLCGVLEFFNFY